MAARITKLKMRRGTAAEWTSQNPVLSSGEIGYETDTNKFKIGNGATAWTALTDYFQVASGSGATNLDELTDVTIVSPANDDFIQRKAGVFVNRTLAQVKSDLGLTGTNSGDETASTLGATINGAASATPNNTDLVATVESSVVKKITWTAVKAFLKTYFDTLYQSALGYTAENTANKDATGGYAGLTLFKINFKNVANTFTSFFTNSNTAARTYTFADRNGTIADDADITNAKARANHTGTQLAATVSDFNSAALTAAPAETTTTAGALINGATGKTTPVDADFLGLMDSAASNILKKLSWANAKATLKTYFDTLYVAVSGGTLTNPIFSGTMVGAKVEIQVACSDETTAITTGTAKATFRMPFAMTLTAVRASVTTAPTGSTILIDINETGTTVLSTKLMIDASEKTSTTATTAYVISDSSLADDSEITIDFDQVGSTIAGAGVKVTLIGVRS